MSSEVPAAVPAKEHPSVRHMLKTAMTLFKLRVVSLADHDNISRLLKDPAVMRFIGLEAGRIPSDGEIRSHVQRAVSVWRTRGWGRWSVFERDTGDFVGFCGFRSEEGTPELVSVVHEKYWGLGYATEASAAVLDYGFNRLHFTEVCAYARPANERALALLDNLNAEYIGLVDFHGVEGAAYILRPGDI